MIEYLDSLDRQILLLLNGKGWPYWDSVMWDISAKFTWTLVALGLLYVFFRRGWREGVFILMMFALVILIADQISSGFFKPFFQRLRPSRNPELEGMLHIVNGYTGGRFGFISSHAANSFGIAVFTSLLFRNRFYTISVIGWALLNSYSRIYLGVHYPGDVLVGSIVGIGAGYLVYWLYGLLRRKVHRHIGLQGTCPYTSDDAYIPMIALYVTIMAVLLKPLYW